MRQTTFRKACLQDKTFFFYEKDFRRTYRIRNGELEQYCEIAGWTDSYIPCIEWLMENCMRRVEIMGR